MIKMYQLILFLFLLASIEFLHAQPAQPLKAGVVKIEAGGKIGTGFIVRSTRNTAYIVTASHVVEGEKHPKIEFLTRRYRLVLSNVLALEGGDPKGLALLVVKGPENLPSGLEALPLDPSVSLVGGESVTVIGFPRLAGPWSTIRGNVVSWQGREIVLSGAIDEGISGGPLIKDGKVVGLVTQTERYGRATPAISIKSFLEGWGIEDTQKQLSTAPYMWLMDRSHKLSTIPKKGELPKPIADVNVDLVAGAARRMDISEDGTYAVVINAYENKIQRYNSSGENAWELAIGSWKLVDVARHGKTYAVRESRQGVDWSELVIINSITGEIEKKEVIKGSFWDLVVDEENENLWLAGYHQVTLLDLNLDLLWTNLSIDGQIVSIDTGPDGSLLAVERDWIENETWKTRVTWVDMRGNIKSNIVIDYRPFHIVTDHWNIWIAGYEYPKGGGLTLVRPKNGQLVVTKLVSLGGISGIAIGGGKFNSDDTWVTLKYGNSLLEINREGQILSQINNILSKVAYFAIP